MRVLNQRAVLDRLRRTGAATRPRIAKDTGLSKPTVGQALADLERHGLVRPIGRTTAGPGRSAVVYEPNPAAGYVLGVDIGRKRIRAAVADLAGSVVARVDERNLGRSAAGLVRTVTELAARIVADAGIAPADVVVKVIGSPGVVDRRSRVVRHAPNLPGWESAGVLDGLEKSLGPVTLVENDANLAALGEHVYGVARDVRVFVCATIGTGVGMGIVVDGVLFRGAHGRRGRSASCRSESPLRTSIVDSSRTLPRRSPLWRSPVNVDCRRARPGKCSLPPVPVTLRRSRSCAWRRNGSRSSWPPSPR
jgi:DNA-binding transcriptional ArsR family regulator